MNTDLCTGCGLCKAACPKQAISMKPKWFGFLYPSINEQCIHCNLCEKNCPIKDIKTQTVLDSYVGYTKDSIRLNESSGGVFSQVSKYVLSQNGIVFGAAFDKDWNVIITYTETDITPMLGSKYVQADVKETYKECKEFLEQGRIVLYTGTPCQIYGLKGYLKNDYDNLITIDIFCHGVPSPTIWQRYLKSFGKEIISINFRDKRNSWETYNFTIKFKDGTEFTEPYNKNKYMMLFLENKILRKSCFYCDMRSNSKADISIGDAWGIQSHLNDHKGLSDIIIHTEKGKKIIEILDIIKEKLSYDTILKTNCIKPNFAIPNERSSYMKYDEPKVAICTDHQHQNIGGALQAVALSDKIKELLPNSIVKFVNQWDYNHTKYFDDNCEYITTEADSSFTHLVVGSDQIWNKRFCNNIPFDDRFLIKDIKNKIVYAASFGHHTLEYTNEELLKIQNSLKNVKYISTREIIGIEITKRWFKSNAISVLDPTMLFEKEYYLNKIQNNENITNSGFFKYVLDDNLEWQNMVTELSEKTNEPILEFNKTVENYLENFNKAKFIVTDSYHGAVFSLIFNKPFICLRNKNRGNDRFDDLYLRFNIDNRFIENLNEMDLSLLNKKPDCLEQIREYRKDSLCFLSKALNDVI